MHLIFYAKVMYFKGLRLRHGDSGGAGWRDHPHLLGTQARGVDHYTDADLSRVLQRGVSKGAYTEETTRNVP